MASLQTLKTLLVKKQAIIESVQSSIDDGGSTFKMIIGLIAKGFGWIPSVGDLVNSLFKGFATADKFYKLLDDQGRVSVKKNAAGQEVIVYHDEQGVEHELGDMKVKTLVLRLLGRIVENTLITKQGIGHGPKATIISDDFVYFASNLLNLIDRVQPYFDQKIIPLEGASIRNLLLLAAMDYIGLIDISHPKFQPGERRSLLSDQEDIKRFQKAMDLLGEMAGIDKARVSVSHKYPSTVYAVYRENVILIEKPASEDPKKTVKHVLVVHLDRVGAIATIRVPENHNEIHTITYPVRPQANFGIGAVRTMVHAEITEAGTLRLSINGFEQDRIELVEPEAIEDTFVVYQGQQHRIASDGTGMVRFDTDQQGVFAYKPLKVDDVSVYVRSRFVAMQTHVTETVNYSKIIDFGIAQETGEERVVNPKGKQEMRLLYKPAYAKRTPSQPGCSRYYTR